MIIACKTFLSQPALIDQMDGPTISLGVWALPFQSGTCSKISGQDSKTVTRAHTSHRLTFISEIFQHPKTAMGIFRQTVRMNNTRFKKRELLNFFNVSRLGIQRRKSNIVARLRGRRLRQVLHHCHHRPIQVFTHQQVTRIKDGQTGALVDRRGNN